MQNSKIPKSRTAVSSDNLTYDLDKTLPGIETPTEDFWVFGYGSLIWNPGFDYIRAVPTRVLGYQRKFCLESTRYRGTEAYPGLVLALAQIQETSRCSNFCDGVAFLVSKDIASDACAYLYEREMQHYSYIPTWIDADFKSVSSDENTYDAGQVLAFVIDPTKPTFRGDMSVDQTAERIAKAVGPRGTNRDYLQETVTALHNQKLNDQDLEQLLELVDARIRSNQ